MSGNPQSTRFSKSVHSERYTARYLNPPFEAGFVLSLRVAVLNFREQGVSKLKEACKQFDLDPYDVAIRWLVHHSKLKKGKDG